MPECYVNVLGNIKQQPYSMTKLYIYYNIKNYSRRSTTTSTTTTTTTTTKHCIRKTDNMKQINIFIHSLNFYQQQYMQQ